VSVDVAVFVFNLETLLLFGAWWVLLGVKLFAACDATIRKDAFYVAADKQNKAFWLLMLVVFLALHIIIRYNPINLLNLIGTVAALVYLADVRPLLRSMHQR
jgi:Protein of unknown function (DUF2516)